MIIKKNNRWEWFDKVQSSMNNELESKNIDNEIHKSGFVFLRSFLFSYFSTIIVELTISNLFFAIIGVFCMVILLMDINIAIFVIVIIIMIDNK